MIFQVWLSVFVISYLWWHWSRRDICLIYFGSSKSEGNIHVFLGTYQNNSLLSSVLLNLHLFLITTLWIFVTYWWVFCIGFWIHEMIIYYHLNEKTFPFDSDSSRKILILLVFNLPQWLHLIFMLLFLMKLGSE